MSDCPWLLQTVAEAEKFFLRKEGVSFLKKASQDIMESADFQSENIGDDAKDQTSAIKMRRQEAMKRAKERYIEDSYNAGGREISEKYRLQLAEFDDALAKEITQGRMRVFHAIRIGAASAVT